MGADTRLIISKAMQKRAGLLFLAKTTGRILLILEDQRWTVPTFERKDSLFTDAAALFQDYASGKIVPIELYLSEDRGFEYSTYLCLVEQEFLTQGSRTIAWASLGYLPQKMHHGLDKTLNNSQIKIKISTVLELKDELI